MAIGAIIAGGALVLGGAAAGLVGEHYMRKGIEECMDKKETEENSLPENNDEKDEE